MVLWFPTPTLKCYNPIDFSTIFFGNLIIFRLIKWDEFMGLGDDFAAFCSCLFF